MAKGEILIDCFGVGIYYSCNFLLDISSTPTGNLSSAVLHPRGDDLLQSFNVIAHNWYPELNNLVLCRASFSASATHISSANQRARLLEILGSYISIAHLLGIYVRAGYSACCLDLNAQFTAPLSTAVFTELHQTLQVQLRPQCT
jgi:hypothetical protein